MGKNLWNNVCLRATIVAVLALTLCGPAAAETSDYNPKLLLTPRRLRRLQRDRERQTVRWLNFENRVQTVPNSPERGFELALYYTVTRDQKRGREAIEWALSHRCDRRQDAIVFDWVQDLITEEDRRKVAEPGCRSDDASGILKARDTAFDDIVFHNGRPEALPANFLNELEQTEPSGAARLYAACEYLIASRVDLPENARLFFSHLPEEFLLGLKPDQVQHPDWMTHVAALALVALDPNLPGSQYLQSWAMEDSQMIREGPGVAYEFLWADPYLPGVGYQNLEPWFYDSNGLLFARESWDENACWIGISKKGIQQENCPAAWEKTPRSFAHVTLIPMNASCIEVPHRSPDDRIVLWQLRPGEMVSYHQDKRASSARADGAGMLQLETQMEGKICRAR